MSSINFDPRSIVGEGNEVVVIEPFSREPVQEQDQPVVTEEEQGNFDKAYRFLRLLDSYNKLAFREINSGVVYHITKQQMDGTYEALKSIAEECPALQASLPEKRSLPEEPSGFVSH